MTRKSWPLVLVLAIGLIAGASSVYVLDHSGCANVTLTFYVFDGIAQIQFEGKRYASGESVSVAGGCGESYGIQVLNTPWPFYQWVTTADGHFSNASTASTAFQVGLIGGAIAAILTSPPAMRSPWGGYVVSGANITRVSGTMRLPEAAGWVAPGSMGSNNMLAMWVGLGGFGDPRTLWQAGILVNATGPGQLTVLPWDEAWPDQLAFNFLPASSLGTIHLGDIVNVTVSYDPSLGLASVTICDATNLLCYSPPRRTDFKPDMTTAEWVVEDPQASPCVVGCFLTPWFTDLYFSSSSYRDELGGDHFGFGGPFLRMVGEGGNYTDPGNRTMTQWEEPIALASNTPTEFGVAYSPNCACP